MNEMYLECIKCGKKYKAEKDTLNCKDHLKYHGYLEVKYDYAAIDEFPLKSKNGVEKYMPLLPVNELKLKLHDFKSPLFKIKSNKGEVYIKDESKNITGSFKDRESLLAVNKAIEFGFDSIYCVSSGNAANSLSVLSKLGGINCTCFIPENVSESKKTLIQLNGGSLSLIGRDYEDCYRKVINLECRGWNCCSGINPYNLEGDKIITFEIFEDMGVPDKIIVPCGNGTNLAGIFKGFEELKIIKKTDKLPQMIGVQIENADPITRAFKQKQDSTIINNPAYSIADSIVASESYASLRTIKALEKSGGFMVNVNDNEIEKALLEIIENEGMIIEPSSAAAFAALKKLDIKENEKIVCILTGSGMKMLDKIKKIAQKHKALGEQWKE